MIDQAEVGIHLAIQQPGHAGPPRFMFQPVRTRLLEALVRETGTGCKLVSLVAPIGYGKTVLMSALHAELQQLGIQGVWVALDDRDTTTEHVLHAIELALAPPAADLHPTQALLRGDVPMEHRIEQLIASVARLSGPVALFLDNLNSCGDETLGQLLDALLFRTPASVQLVWSSTSALDINVSRAKLEGLIRQVGFAELSLDADETRELLGGELGRQIGTAGVDTIQRQTEGWPAAIRLAQIVLSQSPEPKAALDSFSGEDVDVAGLLNRQVLKGASPELRAFLLSLAHLRTFSLSLCIHVMGVAGTEDNLNLLLRRNVFIIPLDRSGKRYRLHGLFRDYLLGESERLLSPESKRTLLRRAADWCEQNAEWADAIDYALAAQELVQASRILDRIATLFARDRGNILQYIDWAERLNTQGVQLGWQAHYWYVWALIFHRRYAYGSQQHERLAERLAQHRGDQDAPPEDFSQSLDFLRICIDILTDRLDDAYQGTERWLASGKSRDPYDIGSVYSMKAVCQVSAYKFALARHSLRVAEPIMLEVGSAYSLGWLGLINATMTAYEGDYKQASKEVSAVLARTRAALGEDAVLCDTMAFVAAKCAVEMGQDDEARLLLLRAFRSASAHGLVGTAACGFDAAVKLWHGGNDEIVSIPDLREVASSYPPRLGVMLSCYLVQRLLVLGHLEEALAEAERSGLQIVDGEIALPVAYDGPAARYRVLHTATAIDLLIATRHYKQAELVIRREAQRALEEGRMARLVELDLATMVIAVRSGNSVAAAKALSQAVARAARRRVVRPFRDVAAVIAALVNDTRPSEWMFAVPEEREFFAEICRSLPPEARMIVAKDPAWSADAGGASMPTKREIELLTLIDRGLSNQELADQTDVSITTIKWHLKNLYRKFGVSNRSAALARAMGLLSR